MRPKMLVALDISERHSDRRYYPLPMDPPRIKDRTCTVYRNSRLCLVPLGACNGAKSDDETNVGILEASSRVVSPEGRPL